MPRPFPPRALRAAALLGLAAAAGPWPALAAGPKPWGEVKCERYGEAWSYALARKGSRGLGPEFLQRHAAFIDSGCTAKADVCPRSAEELDMANALTILAMNAGTASTFPPFACPKPGPAR